MGSLTTVKEVQHLNWRLVALSMFIPKLAEKGNPFFKILKIKNFEWDEECEWVFSGIKRDISALPILTSPPPHTLLFLYFSISKVAVSSVLIYEKDKK